jgi:hypothetical protein
MWETQGKFRKKKRLLFPIWRQIIITFRFAFFFFYQNLLPCDDDVLIRLLSNTSRHIKIK